MTLALLLTACGDAPPGAEIRTIKAGQQYAMTVPAGTPREVITKGAMDLCTGALVSCSVWVWAQPEPMPTDWTAMEGAAARTIYRYDNPATR